MLTITLWGSKMNAMNAEPIFADFGNSDEDGAVRLNCDGTFADLARMGLSFSEGQRVWLTDHDIETNGTVTFRNGIWVAIPDQNGFKQVPLDAAHHINNLKEE
jgi:hypothetical protein